MTGFGWMGVGALAAVLLAAAPALAEPPSSTSSTVTVTAPPVKDVPDMVRRFARPPGDGRLARWDGEVCPSVRGDLPAPFRGFIARRIRQTAISVGGMAAGPRCRVNIAILWSPTPRP